jgi:hypothetical protein
MFKIYPTLLNSYIYFADEIKNSKGGLMIDYQELMDRINRVPKPTTEAQQRGISFEEALVTGKGEDQFPAHILEEARLKLPPKFKTQFYVQAQIEDVLLYGFVDLIGGNQAVDIKTTGSYRGTKFANDAQNLYLLGLKQFDIKTLTYLITDMQGVYEETYQTDEYDFSPLLKKLKDFTVFLKENNYKISNRKIFNEKPTHGQLSLF